MHNHSPTSYNSNHVPLLSPPRRKSRKSRTWLWLILGVIAGLALAGAAFFLLEVFANGAQKTPIVSQDNTIEVPVVVNSDWTVTLNSVTISDGSESDHPAPQNIYLVLDVTLQNTSTHILTASSLHMFDIKNANTGETYQQDINFGQSPDGTVASGGFIRGRIAYEVPAGHHTFTLQFAPGVDGSVLAEWSIMI
jgi:Domain of unknown function (DUF4352)